MATHSYSFALQQYMLLQEEHQVLSTHLDLIRPQPSGSSSSRSRSLHTSPSTSPTRCSSSASSSASLSLSNSPSPPRHSRSSERRPRHRSHGRSSALDDGGYCGVELTTIPDEETLCEISVEEQRLYDVNESIKRALTELLNSGTVRSDRSLRMWVQTRLMETEKELRKGRRRRNNGTTD